MTAVSGDDNVPTILKEALDSKSWGTSPIDNVFNRLPGLKEKVEEEYQKLNAAKSYEPPNHHMDSYNEKILRKQAWVNIFFKEIEGVKKVISEAITSAKMGVPPSSPNWVYDAFVVPYLERIDNSRSILDKDAREKRSIEELSGLFGGRTRKYRRRRAPKKSAKKHGRRRRSTRKH
jgi:hypothetical protein